MKRTFEYRTMLKKLKIKNCSWGNFFKQNCYVCHSFSCCCLSIDIFVFNLYNYGLK